MDSTSFYENLSSEGKIFYLKQIYSLHSDSNNSIGLLDLNNDPKSNIVYGLGNIIQQTKTDQQGTTSTNHKHHHVCNTCKNQVITYIDLSNGTLYCAKHTTNNSTIITIAELNFSHVDEIVQRHMVPSPEFFNSPNSESRAQSMPRDKNQSSDIPVKNGRKPISILAQRFPNDKHFEKLRGPSKMLPACCGMTKTSNYSKLCDRKGRFKHIGTKFTYCKTHKYTHCVTQCVNHITID